MPLTVRQDNRRNTATALSTMFFTSHAQVSSSRYVHFAPGRAHGTCATSTPCSGHRTRGAAACRNVRVVPVSTRAPPPGPDATVVPRARPPALTTPAGRPRIRAHRHHQNLVAPARIDLDRHTHVLDDHALDAQQLPEYRPCACRVPLLQRHKSLYELVKLPSNSRGRLPHTCLLYTSDAADEEDS